MAKLKGPRFAQTARVVTGSRGLSSAAKLLTTGATGKPGVQVHRALSNSGVAPLVRIVTNYPSVQPSEQPSQDYFWTPAWQAGEKAADEDLAAGRYETFDSAEDAIDWLFGDDG